MTTVASLAYSASVLLLFAQLCRSLPESDDNGTRREPTPVVIWHGMGDSCCFSFSMGRIQETIENEIPGVYVKSIRIGNDEVEDVEKSYFDDINRQVAQVCDELSKDERLRNGYHAIGFSQGSQFLRAVAERCTDHRMINYISIGGQHQGIYGLPFCKWFEEKICDYLRKILFHGAYTDFMQERLVQATFWHDPLQEDEYRQKSTLMADINNENYVNETYKENLQKLKAMVLVKFDNDSMVIPRESEWFGFYEPGQTSKLITMQETDLYKEDRIGLRKMYEDGKIHFYNLPSNHLQFSDEWFIANIIKKYLT